MRKLPFRSKAKIISVLLILFFPVVLKAQQPFVTDDADVTPKRKWHLEFSNEFDWLSRNAFPSLRQNTADLEIDYGLSDRVEVGIEAPYLTIFNDRVATPTTASGIGDANLSLKYNFIREREGLKRPAMAIALNLELPTGDQSRQLGSGLADFYMNGVVQKSAGARTKLRWNGGILFSGNETTGVLGIKTRGTVFTTGGSIVRQMNSRFDLGFELVGAVSKNSGLGKSQLQAMVGGNYSMNEHMTFDFGIVTGRHAASPRAGLQLGISIDW